MAIYIVCKTVDFGSFVFVPTCICSNENITRYFYKYVHCALLTHCCTKVIIFKTIQQYSLLSKTMI